MTDRVKLSAGIRQQIYFLLRLDRSNKNWEILQLDSVAPGVFMLMMDTPDYHLTQPTRGSQIVIHENESYNIKLLLLTLLEGASIQTVEDKR